MNEPGGRSFAAKSPLWPFAGWAGLVMGMIFTCGHGPSAVVAGMFTASIGRVRRALSWDGVKAFEYVGVRRYGTDGGQFFGISFLGGIADDGKGSRKFGAVDQSMMRKVGSEVIICGSANCCVRRMIRAEARD